MLLFESTNGRSLVQRLRACKTYTEEIVKDKQTNGREIERAREQNREWKIEPQRNEYFECLQIGIVASLLLP